MIVACSQAIAAEFSAEITDQDGMPLANAVVTLLADAETNMPAATSHLAPEKIVDQRDETFIPLVTIIPSGGSVAFANNDLPMHQVYSFSEIKQFEMTLAQGETSPGIRFDMAGVAAIGCNIHDHMIAYIVVTDSPWTALTNESGHLEIAGVPAGNYTAKIWHPRLPPASVATEHSLTIGDTPETLRTSLTVLPDRTRRRTHSGGY